MDDITSAKADMPLSADALNQLQAHKLELRNVVADMDELATKLLGLRPRPFLDGKGKCEKMSTVNWQLVRGKVQRLRDRARVCPHGLSACIGLLGRTQQWVPPEPCSITTCG